MIVKFTSNKLTKSFPMDWSLDLSPYKKVNVFIYSLNSVAFKGTPYKQNNPFLGMRIKSFRETPNK